MSRKDPDGSAIQEFGSSDPDPREIFTDPKNRKSTPYKYLPQTSGDVSELQRKEEVHSSVTVLAFTTNKITLVIIYDRKHGAYI
jgi:hypothetical protein